MSRAASEWIYRGVWSMLTDWFLVPRTPPSLPAGSGGAIESLQPCAGWLAYRRLIFWIVLTLIDGALIIVWSVLYVHHPKVALWLAAPWLLIMVVPDIFAFIALYLRYDTTWYILSDRSMRIRRGVIILRETTITFDNVQNVKVTQGPMQRYFGFSDLVIETAGGGGSGPHGSSGMGSHVGILEGVAEPAALRERIMARVRASRSAGLGDERETFDASPPASGSWSAAHLEALRDIAREAESLRAALS